MAKQRWEGTRWRLCFGRYDGVEQFAVNELQREVQAWLPYTLEVTPAAPANGGIAAGHEILVGTTASNARIAELNGKKWLTVPSAAQGYAIRVGDSPWANGRRLAVIAGSDERGLLYGVEEFNARVLGLTRFCEPPTPELLRKDFDNLPDVSLTDQPAIENRGIWTWGYVIYDYRRFIDNMARLKMNMLTIWNDCAPLNSPDIISYAHSRGVKVVFGFHWGWGIEGLELGKAGDRRKIKEMVLRQYDGQYRGLGMDGIYFQTITETADTRSGEMTVAAAACALVNDVSRALLAQDPNLLIQFGLHATSIRDNLDDLKSLDKRVVIVWEDAGSVPYSYYPAGFDDQNKGAWLEAWQDKLAAGKDEFACTIAYSRKLATFRPGTEFGMVPKGWISLRWGREFENHGPFILGERQPHYIRQRLQERQPRWDDVNVIWPRQYARAAQFYREILDCKPPVMTVTGLVEDGLFEAAIQPSVAVLAQTIWNPCRADDELVWLASSPYYRKTQV